MLLPPGYTTSKSLRALLQQRGMERQEFDFDEQLATGEPLVGTPEQVGEKLVENMEKAGAGIFMGSFHIGDMPHHKVMRNLELFHDRVMPYLPQREKAAEPAPAK